MKESFFYCLLGVVIIVYMSGCCANTQCGGSNISTTVTVNYNEVSFNSIKVYSNENIIEEWFNTSNGEFQVFFRAEGAFIISIYDSIFLNLNVFLNDDGDNCCDPTVDKIIDNQGVVVCDNPSDCIININ